MPKTSSVFTRIEPEVKEQAEQVLSALGIPMSSAISMFLRQIVIQNGMPFELKAPPKCPLFYHELTREQFDEEIKKGMDDVEAGRVIPIEQVWSELGI